MLKLVRLNFVRLNIVSCHFIYCHRYYYYLFLFLLDPRSNSQRLSHPKFGIWPARDKHTPMPPKPWPLNYLLKFRHNLTRLGRLPTCKIRKPLTRILHTTCTQLIAIVNYKFTYNTSKCIQHYQSSTEYLCDVDYKNTIHDKRNNTRRLFVSMLCNFP